MDSVPEKIKSEKHANWPVHFLGEITARAEHLGLGRKDFNILNHDALLVPISILKQSIRDITAGTVGVQAQLIASFGFCSNFSISEISVKFQ